MITDVLRYLTDSLSDQTQHVKYFNLLNILTHMLKFDGLCYLKIGR